MLNETKSEGFPVKEIWVSVFPTEGGKKKKGKREVFLQTCNRLIHWPCKKNCEQAYYKHEEKITCDLVV